MSAETIKRIESCIAKRTAYIKTVQQAAALRKMVFAMSNNIEDVLTCITHHLEKMRTLRYEVPEIQKEAALEAIDIWAPIADRLGISAIKDELEDLSLKYSNPDVFEHIKHIVALKKVERSQYLERSQKEIYRIAEKNGITVNVKSRAKHFWSIYQKMKKRNKSADELFDLMALRILCNTSDECYRLIGLMHTLWKPVDKRFKDYIAAPKANGYQSLHTTVMCDNMPLEIQIRTHEMHDVAEHGVASHWLYKQRNCTVQESDVDITNKLSCFVRSDDSEKFFDTIKKELLGSLILVFTPKGDVVQLPQGATAIDFAYYIHSNVGEKIIGAKADDRIIPLSTPLETTQSIEIQTSQAAHPTFNQLQLVKTAKARAKIRQYLALHDDLYKEKQGDSGLNEEKNAELKAIALKITEQKQAEKRKAEAAAEVFKIRIDGSTNFIISLARCCNPSSSDNIIGYVSRGRGIVIHKKNCQNLSHIAEIERRIVQVEWEKAPELRHEG